jgi:biopolymer transport protein ExbD
MRFTRRKSVRGDFDVMITSLLDINFLLIMFFIVTAQFQREIRAALDLPQERGERKPRSEDDAGLVINMNAAGELIVANRPVAMELLRGQVRAEVEKAAQGEAPQAVRLLLRIDRKADATHLNSLITELKGLGVAGVRMATEMPR